MFSVGKGKTFGVKHFPDKVRVKTLSLVNTLSDAFSLLSFPLGNFWICASPVKVKVASHYVSS